MCWFEGKDTAMSVDTLPDHVVLEWREGITGFPNLAKRTLGCCCFLFLDPGKYKSRLQDRLLTCVAVSLSPSSSVEVEIMETSSSSRISISVF